MKWTIPLFALLLTACAGTPVKQEPFQQYLEAVQQVAQGVDGAIGREFDRELSDYEHRFKTGEETDITRLFLEPDLSNAYAISYATPPGETELVFLAIADQRAKLQAVNALAIDYATLLVRIVGAETGAFDVERQAAALNTEARKFLAGDEAALLSTAFVTVAKQYIETKRRDKLQAVLAEGQPVIDAYASLGRNAAKTAAASVKRGYAADFEAAVRRDPTNVQGVLAINERVFEQLEVLRNLDKAFVALAANHARLQSAVAAGDSVSFQALVDQAKTLKELYGGLKAENE
jgi:hypothetical protein